MNVAEIVLPFEFTQPTLEIEDITTTLNDQSKWTVWSGTTALTSYGAYGAATKDEATPVEMYLPMYEAFDAWATKYTAHKDQVKYYRLSNSDASVTLLGKPANSPASLADLTYTSTWSDWDTHANDASVTYNAAGEEVEKKVSVKASFSHYGVYAEPKVTNFDLTFASLLNHSTLKMAAGKETLVVNTGTHDVFISNDDLDLTSPKGGKFFLFDGLDKNDNVVLRKNLNALSFNEEQHGFMTEDQFFAFDANRYAINFKAKAKNAKDGAITYNIKIVDPDRNPVSGYDWAYDLVTGKRTYTLPAPDPDDITIYRVKAVSKENKPAGAATNATVVSGHTGGMVIQLPTKVADQEEVEITMTVEDGLGFTNDLKFTVKKIM